MYVVCVCLSFAFAVILRYSLLRTAGEMYKGLLNTLVQPLFCSLNLFSVVLFLVCSRIRPAPVAVVVLS